MPHSPGHSERSEESPPTTARNGAVIVSYYVYMMSNASKTLYVGVTNDLPRRVMEHRNKTGSAFVRKYNVTSLVYIEQTGEVGVAIAREKQIKGWLRSKKVALIESANPEWRDLSREFV